MSLRKRRWKAADGATNESWVADYVDARGKRRRKAFARKKDADQFSLTARTEVRDGVHVADAETITVMEAGRLWVKSGEAEGLERATLDQRRQHLSLHIKPFIGDLRLNKITVPRVRDFQDELRAASRSLDMVKRVTVRNPVHERARARSGTVAASRRAKRRLQIGADIPSRDEVKALLGALAGRWRPLLLTAIFTGMRSSELRGLTWANVELDAKVVHVRQRADVYNDIGRPKSEAGDRSIPMPPLLVNALREWKLACPRRDRGRRDANGEPVMVLDLVFPNGAGNVENRKNIASRGLIPAMIRAGVAIDTGETDEEGKPVFAAKYTGLHALRHFYASWCINPIDAGGQGLSPKAVQERMGHSSIAMTMDTYGHLFPADEDGEILAAAERSLLTR